PHHPTLLWPIVECNETACRMNGFAREELIGQPLNTLHATHLDAETLSEYLAEIKREGLVQFEALHQRKDGNLFPIEVVTSIVNLGGREMVLGIDRDITERKQTEAMRARMAMIVDSTHDAIISVDRLSRITSWNAGAERITGYSAAAAIGRSVVMLVPRAERPERITEYEEWLAHGEPILRREESWQRQDGQIIDVGLTISKTPAGDYAVVARDISTQKQAAAELARARDAALESSRLKSEFLATVSHEIRTPMNGVIGMAELLLDTTLDAEQREFAETINESAQALLAIINDILDYSKIEADKIMLDASLFSPVEVLGSVGSILGARARAKGIALSTEISGQVPFHLFGDAGRLRQVLLNLAGNAVKFTEHGGVSIRAELASAIDETITLRFTVSDTGIGIPAAALAHLFQPFMQADGSVTRKYGGTGLGLAISKRLAELMGGAIGCTSVAGQGSTFWFTAQFGKAEQQPNPEQGEPEAPEIPLGHGLVLLAEDNYVNQKLARRQLAKLGFSVDIVSTGQAAVERATRGEQRYRLVLMDCHMPEMDGFGATRAIRAHERMNGTHLPIIAMTASALRGDREACMAAGMDDFLAKPVRQAELRAMLERWLPPSNHEATEAVLDPTMLDELRSLSGNAEIFGELMLAFQHEIHTQLAALQRALAEGNCAALAQAAHHLRGSSANFGATGLAAVCARLEAHGRSGELAISRALSPQLDDAATQVLDELSVLLQTPVR
ncbi:MAG TPA: PAS domain S-box protein, partial [Roseiflexaceae bacterium]|nr:PAS domain S-box protein [Roseiflexaceae bacterium]